TASARTRKEPTAHESKNIVQPARMATSVGGEPELTTRNHLAELGTAPAENISNAVPTVQQSPSTLQRQQASPGSGVTLSYASSAPVQRRCGDFSWQIKWVLQGATSATNGFIVQKVRRETMTQRCDDTSDHIFEVYWEAWQVKGGKILAGTSETVE